LFAAEPFVRDPVELVFDDRGAAYVVEMSDYPYKPEPGRQRSRFKRLDDTDGDGRVDRATVFADTLSEATSALPWQGGFIVASAPHLYYLKDTDGDGVADEREILFGGFFEHNAEAQITNIRFNVDNWIYASNFGQPGTVTSARDPEAPALNVLGCDFRFRLDTGEFECAAGPTQFGQAIDDAGTRFATHNTQHIGQLVIPWRYLHRHEALNEYQTLVNISDHDLRMFQLTPAPYWRAERTARRQKRYTEDGLDRVEHAADHFTGSSGGTYYDGDLFPAAYYGNVFTGDVAGNLVHRDILVPGADSPLYTARRAPDEQSREFLASTDSWFRPANFTVGPDGALYIVDFYRQHIETPLSIPDDLKADMDFYAGENRGRIYRIVPEGAAAVARETNLADASTEVLIGMLEHANGWHRRTAHRLLIERGAAGEAGKDSLRNLVDTSVQTQARLRALSVLRDWGVLEPSAIQWAMGDSEPDVRILASRFAETCEACHPDLILLANDPDPRVLLQAAMSLGTIGSSESIRALAHITSRFEGDPWIEKAVLSSKAGSSIEMLASLIFFEEAQPEPRSIVRPLGEVIGRRNDPEQVEAWLSIWLDGMDGIEPTWLLPGLRGLVEGLRSHDEPPVLTDRGRFLIDRLLIDAEPSLPDQADSLRILADSILSLTAERTLKPVDLP
jgi:putative membrane-bound dehydrogenase-like protein